MNQKLQQLLDSIQQSAQLSDDEKNALTKSMQEVDKEMEITNFKLDRTEKVKRTTAILLEETISELEHKRKAVEAQNRELEIESALERVRTVAMGMNKPDDMLEVCKTIALQLQSLGVKEIRNVQTAIFYEARGTYMNYEFYAKHDKTFVTETIYTNHEVAKAFAEKMFKGTGEVFITSIRGSEVKDWLAYQKTTNVFIDSFLENASSLDYYWHSLGPVALGISTYNPLNGEELQLFQRFLKVFDLSYRRYLDIEKAIAQAREAKIEAALEKVRSRSLAMHKSEELNEVVAILFEKLKELQIPATAVGLGISIEGSKDLNTFVCGENEAGLVITNYRLPFFENRISKELYNALEKQLDFFVGKYSKKEKNSFYEYLFEHSAIKDVPDGIKRMIFESATYTISIVTAKNVVFNINDFEGKNLTENEIDIFKRFAKVFDQAYTRFLDLQKAEAQAKEAKIESALERIRSRSLAMHHSSELSAVVDTLLREFTNLEFTLTFCIINLIDEQDRSNTVWAANPETGKDPEAYYMKFEDYPFHHAMWDAWKEQQKNFIYTIEGEEKKIYDEYLYTNTEFRRFPKHVQEANKALKRYVAGFTFFKHSGLQTVSENHISDDELDILERFGRVFEQSYTRFLDLQKAEAQARESQIQLALERVRARTMAMQHSEELAETAYVLFQQFSQLGDAPDQITIGNINEEERVIELWLTMQGALMNRSIKASIDEPIVMHKMYVAWKEQQKSLVIDLTGQELQDYTSYRNKLSESNKVPVVTNYSDKRRVINVAFFSKGLITFSTTEPKPTETIQLLERFANVFEQTYTRFLDLQKAEAQAKEAQVELALERVRARTMAMQHSEELMEASNLLFQQVQSLGIPVWTCGYNIWEKGEDFCTGWMSTNGEVQPSFRIPLTHGRTFMHMNESRLKGEPFYVEEIGGEALAEHYGNMLSLPDFKSIADLQLKDGFSLPTFQINHVFNFKHGNLIFISGEPVPNAWDIFKRFTAVFEQTYTRFLDLQKAEAQTREAQVEVAVERVRAKALAMHKSGEIMNVALTMRTELESLHIPGFSAATITLRQEDGTIRLWDNTSAKQHEDGLWESTDFVFRLEKNNPDFYINRLWNSNEKYFVVEQDENDLLITIDWVRQFDSAMADVVEHYFKENGIKHAWHPTVQLTHGRLNLDFYSAPEPEMETILLKMGAAFDLAYKRFLDLQNAEAQTREAKIEAALERTRTQSMIMQHSKELDDTLRVFHEQVLLLGINSAFSFLWLPDEKNDRHIFWAAWKENDSTNFKSKAINYPLDRNEPATAQCLVDWKGNDPIVSYHVPPPGVENYFASWQELIDGVEQLKPKYFSGGLYYVEAFMKYGCFGVMVANDLTEDEKKILGRFSIEFERTYTRFLDLEKAEAQAREAKIEAALEKARSRSMGMQSSDELPEVANVLFLEVQALGIPAWSCGYNIITEDKTAATCWMSSEGTLQLPFKLRLFGEASFAEMGDFIRSEQTMLVQELGDKALQEHYAYMKSFPDLKPTFNQIDELGLSLPTYQINHLCKFTQGFLLFITYEKVPDSHDIFKRFTKVFEQTYTRFLDLQKAEAQAREAQIEAALERVRSRSMAMQRSDELVDVATVLFQQVKALGVPQWNCGFNIWNIGDNEFTYYPGSPDGIISPSPCKIPLTEHPVFMSFDESRRRGDELFIYEKEGDEQADHYRYMLSLPGVGDLLKSMLDAGFELPKFQIDHLANFAYGNLIFITYEHFPKMHDVFKRFAKVFEQTYTRFLDLQKAEAQARESQIEAALEKVRSSSLAMHHSEELQDVVNTVIERLKALEISLDTSNILIFNKSERIFQVWTGSNSTGKQLNTAWQVSWVDLPWIKELFLAFESEDDVLTNCYPFEVKNKIFDYLFSNTDFKKLNPERKKFIYESPVFTPATAFVNHVGIQVISYSRESFSQDEIDIFNRFAKVFNQAYTRFLDLQKAEAQAREATIETALEKVRSRSMAMHRSGDLHEVIKVVTDQFSGLGLKFDTTNFAKVDSEGSWDLWIPARPEPIHVPYFNHRMFSQINEEVVTKGLDFFAEVYGYEEKNIFFNHIFENTVLKNTPKERKQFVLNSEGFARSVLLTKNIWLSVIKFDAIPFSDEDNAIFKRFAKVFEQTYTRFLDLQKAEAQAREAQIELGLERVRARAMAMKHSDELNDVAAILYNQLRSLGGSLWTCAIALCNHNSNEDEFRTAFEGGLQPSVFVSHNEDEVHIKMYEGWKNAVELFTICKDGSELQAHYAYMMTIPTIKPTFEKLLASGISFPVWQKWHAAYFTAGYLMIITTEHYKEETIFVRFAKVFEQAYTRFLDLQKAEAQAREALIEAGLERVRSRSLAMHNTAELQEVIHTVHKELLHLNIAISGGSFIAINKDIQTVLHCWGSGGTANTSEEVILPLYEKPFCTNLINGIKKGPGFFTEEFSQADKKKFFTYLFKHEPWSQLDDKQKKETLSSAGGYTRSCCVSKHTSIFIINHFGEKFSESDNEILKRFAKVFEQAYTRFLDLQKAEAQAREAQIEAALERVRSRTMAMQKSEELTDVAGLLFKQVTNLGINSWTAGFNVWSDDNNSYVDYITSPNGGFIEPYTVLTDRAEALQDISNARKSGVEFDVQFVEGEKIKQLYIALTGLGEEQFEKMRQDGNQFPSHQYEHFVFGSRVSLMFITYEPVPQAHDIFKRFGKVFEQTYTRFLDLQKAEAQAREAQIQLALERVRARAMAMQHSVELREIAAAVHDQLQGLGFTSGFCSIVIMDSISGDMTWWMFFPGKEYPESYHMPFVEHPFYLAQLNNWKQGKKYSVIEVSGEEKKSYDKYTFSQTEFVKIPIENQEFMMSFEKIIFSNAYMKHGAFSWGVEPIDEEHAAVLQRFASVFEQCYTRFLDLQKAEAQAREAQIEAALERVRGKAMAMYNSDDLSVTVSMVFTELRKLDINPIRCGVGLLNKGSHKAKLYAATSSVNGDSLSLVGWAELSGHPVLEKIYDIWLKNEDYFPELTGAQLQSYYSLLLKGLTVALPDSIDGEKQYGNFLSFSVGCLYAWSAKPYGDSELKILKRFAAIIDLTFRRYIDLQKAEAQAREAQIEAGLERVRSRSLAMHNTSELQEVIHTVHKELLNLKIAISGGSFITLNSEIDKELRCWGSGGTANTLEEIILPIYEKPFCANLINGIKNGPGFFTEEFSQSDKKKFFTFLFKHEPWSSLDDKQKKETLSSAGGYTRSCCVSQHTSIFIINHFGKIFSEDDNEILKRFAKVFEQAYTRFLDLQKAEAQVREAKIEAALERVRSRTMAMHNSEDVGETVATLFDELVKLDVHTNRCGILIANKENMQAEVWTAKSNPSGKANLIIGQLDLTVHPLLQGFYQSWKNKQPVFIYSMFGEDIKSYYRAINAMEYYPTQFDLDALPEKEFHTDFYFADGAIFAFTPELIIEEVGSIFKRFSKVFGQTYRRYLDLQKAEAQVREAQIQLALERVRARTMAMQRSDELSDAATILFQQVKALGVPQWTCGFNIWEMGDKVYTFYPGDPDGHVLAPCRVPLTEHWVSIKMDESRKRGEEFYMYEKEGEQQQEHYRYMLSLPGGMGELLQNMLAAGMQIPTFQIDHFANFSHGNLMFITYEHFPEMHDIFKRFAKVFEQTYTRFLDLKKAEAQGLEAIKRASVDRVRAEIASMRTTNDLERITPLIWRELTTLGIPFIRCGVFIMDEANEQIQTLLSTSDGKAIASFQLPYDNTEPLTQLLPHWRRKEVYKDHWDEAAFIESTRILLQRGAIASPEIYSTDHRPTELYLHFLPFLQGMLYVGNATPLKEDELQLVQNLAEAFSIAYARYEDFNKLEAANIKIEKTLVDLKLAQAQLVQSEKMASLGELTAGIAHEIQNPLNFVNNFSEVSTELIDEMNEEIAKGNLADAKEIANDLKQNLEKINHHGKRAGDIVKGMLQHSRSSTAVKEPVDINALADEYLRLAYHGLRAKDKSFNATLETNYDKTIELINIIPQDIGRVLLNLYNNAFYAVAEKKKGSPQSASGGGADASQIFYEPTVSVSTKKIGTSIEISVTDNGNGIPQKVVDKIFQPFFTTKPTGQGTGLGLSLSFDIVKAHGGEIKVTTKEGEESEFFIHLPNT